MNTLRNTIMRRIYYAYAIQLSTHRYTVHALLAALALYAFSQLVFVAAIIQNMLQVRVGSLPNFFLGALRDTDTLTLLSFVVVLGIGVSLLRNIRPVSARQTFTTA